VAYRVLAAALGDLEKAGLMSETGVKMHVINPKSITIEQLYGSFDKVSREWLAGVLPTKFSLLANDTSRTRKWLVFDGPVRVYPFVTLHARCSQVDAVWVENMNSVLDDSKKLCLTSGSMIYLSDLMNIVFEVRDLSGASPATVSRCGMVYMDPQQLCWRPLVTSWLITLPKGFDPKLKKRLELLFDWLVAPCIAKVKEFAQYSSAPDTALVVSLMRLFETLVVIRLVQLVQLLCRMSSTIRLPWRI